MLGTQSLAERLGQRAEGREQRAEGRRTANGMWNVESRTWKVELQTAYSHKKHRRLKKRQKTLSAIFHTDMPSSQPIKS